MSAEILLWAFRSSESDPHEAPSPLAAAVHFNSDSGCQKKSRELVKRQRQSHEVQHDRRHRLQRQHGDCPVAVKQGLVLYVVALQWLRLTCPEADEVNGHAITAWLAGIVSENRKLSRMKQERASLDNMHSQHGALQKEKQS
jgi:hypothetical protein